MHVVMTSSESTTAPIDPVLQPYLRSTSPDEDDRILGSLLEQATPTVRAILRSKLARTTAASGAQLDQDELVSEVLFRIVRRLHRLRVSPDKDPIGNFSGYVAVTTYNAFHAHVREKHPERHRLRSRVRYVARTMERFRIWQAVTGETFCGLRSAPETAPTPAAWEPPPLLRPIGVGSVDALTPESVAAVLGHIFAHARGPIELDRLGDLVAGLLHLSVVGQRAGDLEGVEMAEDVPSAEDVLVDRAMLRDLWGEIVTLPPRQRTALLLHLRDGSGVGVMSLLVFLGVASLEELAAMVGMTVEELSGGWNDLPFDDLRIAARLDLTRQQVINLRKSARERLWRRFRTPRKRKR